MKEIRKCLQCGGEIINGRNGIPVCKYCGTEYRDNVGGYSEELESIIRERQLGRFADAERLCRELIVKQPESSEAHWQMLLIRMGVIYEHDERAAKSEPTFWGYSYAKKELISNNEWYKKTINLAGSTEKRQHYRNLCENLDKLLNDYYALVDQSEEYDIFISFKNTETYFTPEGIEKQKPTYDSKKAEEIYNILTGNATGFEHNKGKYKVFFSNITLEEEKNIGKKYEPKILRALQTAKAMILVGSEARFIESVWVQNEWLRYLNYMDNGIKETGSLILAYKEVESCPPIFLSSVKGRQYRKVDLDKLGWDRKLLDILSFVETKKPSIWDKKKKITEFNDKKEQTAYNRVVHRIDIIGKGNQNIQLSASEQTLLRNADQMRKSSHFKDSIVEYSTILSNNSKNSKAYWGRFCATVKVSCDDDFKQALAKNTEIKIEDFDKAIEFCASEEDAWEMIDVVIKALHANISLGNLKSICDILAKYLDAERAKKVLSVLGNKLFAAVNNKQIQLSESLFDCASKFLGHNENDDYEYIYNYSMRLYESKFFEEACTHFIELIYRSDKKAEMYFYLFKSRLSVHNLDSVVFYFGKKEQNNNQLSEEKEIKKLSNEEIFERGLIYSIEENNIDIQREVLKMLLYQIEKLKGKAKGLIEEIIACYNTFSMENIIKKYFYTIGNKYLLIGCFKEAEEYFNVLVKNDEDNVASAAHWGLLKCSTKKSNDIALAKIGSKIKKYISFNNAINCASDEDVQYFMSIYNGDKKLAKNNLMTKEDIDYFFYEKDDIIYTKEEIIGTCLELDELSEYNSRYYDGEDCYSIDTSVEDFFPYAMKVDIGNDEILIAQCASKNICAGDDMGVAAIQNNGDIIIQYNEFQNEEVARLQGIVEITAGQSHIVGLKPDRTVVAIGANKHYQCEVSNWRDIIAISANHLSTVGLKSNGTVVAVGDNTKGQCEVFDWEDIIAISTSGFHTVGLKEDGAVVAVGDNAEGQCNIESWKDIIAISAGRYHTVGLKVDGTVVAVGDNTKGQCDVSDWEHIVAVSAGCFHTVGLKEDGAVVAVGANWYGQCDVSKWNNIVAISTGTYTTIGLRADGVLVAIGDERYPEGETHIFRSQDVCKRSVYFNWLVEKSRQGDKRAQNQFRDVLELEFESAVMGITSEEHPNILRDLAKQGMAIAQYYIYMTAKWDVVNCYHITREESEYWLEEAAKNGYYPAQIEIAEMHEFNYDDSDDIKDLEKAEYWYEQAAKSGIPSVKFLLADVCIRLGKNEKAKQLYDELIAVFGYVDAISKKPSRDEKGHLHYEIKKNPILIQIEKYCDKKFATQNYEIATYVIEKFALNGHRHAQFLFAQMYEKGKGVGKDWVKAMFWYKEWSEHQYWTNQGCLEFVSNLRKGIQYEDVSYGTTPIEAFII